jgi:hypothetical protein
LGKELEIANGATGEWRRRKEGRKKGGRKRKGGGVLICPGVAPGRLV